MQAAVVRSFGTPRFEEFDEPPSPGPGQAVVDVLAAGVNNVDAVTARGGLPKGPLPPFVAGREGVGLVGGRRVYFDGPPRPFGSMAERAPVDLAGVYDVPDGVSNGGAVTIGIAGLAAWVSLSWRAALRAEDTVLVLGASTMVGQIAVQAARLLGARRIIAAARSVEGQKRAHRLGAHEVVSLDAEQDTVTRAIADAGRAGVSVVIDLLGGPFPGVVLPACSRHARYVQIGNLAGAASSLPAPLLREKMVDLLGYTTRHAPPDLVRSAYTRMAGRLLDGELLVEVDEVPLEDVNVAWGQLTSSDHRKIVLRP